MARTSGGTPEAEGTVAHPAGWPDTRIGRTIQWIDYRLPIFTALRADLVTYPTPVNLNYWWNFGSLAGIVLVIMIATGVVLAMHYTPNADLAFGSVERIMRDVNYGWLLRYIHMKGASMFFVVVYIHMFRGLYYGSYKYPRELLWMLGVVILLLMMATAFMGYVLPWGQMSYWGATVITNLFSAIPLIGDRIVTLLWGGFTVANPTLNRFFSLHYLLPFVIVAVVFLHLMALHQHGSNNPLGIDRRGPQDSIPFHPYYTVKDMFGLCVFLLFFAIFVFYTPSSLTDAGQFHPSQPDGDPAAYRAGMVLPAILRDPAVDHLRCARHPSKLLGVILMFSAVLILFLVPWLDTSPVRSARFRPIYRIISWFLVIDAIVLGYVGSQLPQGPIVTIGQIATAYYFIHFLILMPLIGKIETPRPLPLSIGAAVLGPGAARPAHAAQAERV